MPGHWGVPGPLTFQEGVLMITSADVPAPKPEPNHRPLPVFSSQAGLASFGGVR